MKIAVRPFFSISIHALLAESDLPSGPGIGTPVPFLSTLSLRRATLTVNMWFHTTSISIHALLAESDPAWLNRSKIRSIISIHALLAESDKHGKKHPTK